jgi:hypothetical protein
MSQPPFNPGQNLRAFVTQSASPRPPDINAVYLRDGVYDDVTTRESIAASFDAFRAAPAGTRLALFFHGGLVDKGNGSQAASNQYERYRDIAFPLFFIWQSGIFELLDHHLPLIFEQTLFGQLKQIAESHVGAKLGIAAPGPGKTAVMGLGAEPAVVEQSVSDEKRASLDVSIDDMDAFAKAIASDDRIRGEVGKLVAANAAQTSAGLVAQGIEIPPLIAEDVHAAIVAAAAKPVTSATIEQGVLDGGLLNALAALVKFSMPILVNTLKRFRAKRDHGFTCTIVEEILRAVYGARAGSSIWTEMKQETAAAFSGPSAKFGGTAVVEELVKLIAQRPDVEITLVGHSAGAVYIGNLLQAFDLAAKDTFDFDVILMAPACTFDFFRQKYDRRIRAIRLFGMTDVAESGDRLIAEDDPNHPVSWRNALGPIYPRSLLYLISGVLETFEPAIANPPHDLDGSDMPILGMHRFFELDALFTGGDYPSIALGRSTFSGSKNVRVLSPTPSSAPPGFASHATKHGNFPGDEATIASVHLCFEQGLPV